LRLLNTYLRKSLFAAGGRQRLGALLLSAMVVASAAPAGAAENYRGHDPDSYECSSDFNILNRFSAPRGVPAQSTKYADIKFTKRNNVISVKDASNSKDLATVIVGVNTKYCALKEMQIAEEKQLEPQECNTKYNVFRTRIVIATELPVRGFAFPVRPPSELQIFEKMNHFVDVDLYRTADWKKRHIATGCLGSGGTPDIDFYRFSYLDLMTNNSSSIRVEEVAPLEYRQDGTYIRYERQATKKAGPGVPQPK
jgi:hypothetical protein